MAGFNRRVPPVPVVLAAMITWASFAWGLPTEVGEGAAEPAAADRWAGVRISDAYDELRCPYCWVNNELTAARCSSCGYEFPQPSAEVTDADMVFVPGKGYYREGTLLEPAKSRKGLWVAGLVITVAGAAVGAVAVGTTAGAESPGGMIVAYVAAPIAIGVGAVLLIVGLSTRTEAVYAFDGDERYALYERPSYARRTPEDDDVALKVEVTLLSF